MADVNANIGVHIDTSASIAQLKALRSEISRFHQSINKSSAAASLAQRDFQTNLINSINATGKFHAKMGIIRTSTEAFTHALETNKLTMREYFRYAGGASTTFRKLFTKEFDTINKVARDRVKQLQTQYIKLGRDASGAMKAISITPTTLNMKDYGTQVAIAAQKQALLNQLLKQGSTNLLNFGKNTQWAGRQLMVGFTIPLAYLGTAAAKTFMKLEEQAVKFKRVYGELFTTSAETNKALEDVRKIAEEFTKYGVAVENTMELAAKAAATGKMGAELNAQVIEATRLAVLGAVEQEQALDTTISLTNAFGIAAEDLAAKINFLNAVENQTVVSIEDLTIAIPKAGPVVKQLGGNVEDLAFFLTAMKEGGINASEGANALKSGLASLINPTDKASKMLASMGINIKGIVEANKGNIRNTVIGFAQALDTLDPLNRARAIEQLFGKFQFARLSTLFQNVTKEGTQAARVLDLVGASTEELAILSERELKNVEDAIGVNFKEAVQQLRLALEPIGKVFLETIIPVVKFLGRLLDKFNGLEDGTKKFLVVLTTLVGVVGPVFLMTFGLIANAVANIIKLFTTMRSGMHKLQGGSTVLAEQTNYLTKEQMEATQVAAALDQAHNRLTQRFTSEAQALATLRQAFDSATAAQARFAAANPGMMMPGFAPTNTKAAGPAFRPGIKGGGAGPRFASGTTEVVGGQAGKDSVPSLLMPGEAVVPTDIAQDPRFKPLIAALVTGEIAQYGTGSTGVELNGREYNAKTARGAKPIRDFMDSLIKNPDGTLTYIDPKTREATTFSSQRLRQVFDYRSQPGKEFTLSEIKRSLSIGSGKRGAGVSSRPPWIKELTQKAQYPNILAEKAAIESALEKQGIKPLQSQSNNLFGVQASHIVPDVDATGKKIFRAANLVPDAGWVNNYLNTVGGRLGKDLLAMSDDQLKTLGIDRNELRSLVIDKKHPVTGKAAGTLANIARYQLRKDPKNYQAHAVVAGMDYRAKTNYYPQSGAIKTLAQLFPKNAKVIEELSKKFVVGKGETLLDTKGKATTVTGQTGKPKPPSMNVVKGGPSDRRVIPGSNITRIFPRGFRGPRLSGIGAEEGFPQTPTSQARGLRTGGIPGGIDPATGLPMSELERRLRVSEKLLKLDEEKTTATKSATDATKDEADTKKQLAKQKIAGRLGAVGMVAGTASMGAYMTGNTGAGNALMGLSVLSMIGPMLMNPVGAIVGALALVGGAIYAFNKAMKQAREEGIALGKSLSMTNEKMIELSKVTGKVSAPESAARRRQNLLTGTSEAQRKTGQTILGSEFGKSLLADVEKQSKAGGTSETIGTNLGVQLSQAIMAGAIDTIQARSLAAAIGEQLNDYKLSANIVGEIITIVGPNGENIGKDPIKTALEIDRKSFEQTTKVIKQAGQTNFSKEFLGKGGTQAIAQSALRGEKGLGQKLMANVNPYIYQDFFDPKKSGLDKTLSIVSFGLTSAFFQIRDAHAATNKIRAAGAQMMIQELQNSQQMHDSINQQYDTLLKTAKTEKEIDSIEQKRVEAHKELNKQNKQQMQTLLELKDSALGESAFVGAIESATMSLYKEGPMKAVAEATLSQLNALENSSFKTTLQLELASGNIDPLAIVELMNNPELTRQFNIVADSSSTADAATIMRLFQKGGLDGDDMALVFSIVNPEGDRPIDELNAIASTLGGFQEKYGIVIDQKVLGSKNVSRMVDALEAAGFEGKSAISQKELKTLVTTNPEYEYILDSWSTLVGDGKTITREMLLNLSLAVTGNQDILDFYMQSAGTDEQKAFLDDLKAREKKGVTTVLDYQRKAAIEEDAGVYVTANRQAFNEYRGIVPAGGGGGGTAKRDTTLDELLKKLKFVRDASINAEGGLKTLMKITSGKGVTKFVGVQQQLMAGPKGGMNREFISFLESMDNKTRKTYMTIKNGQVVLTKQGKALKEAFNEKVIGEYQVAQKQSLQDTKAQSAALKRLAAAGVDSSIALEMVSDANLAVAINSKDISAEELRAMADEAKRAKDEIKTLNLEVLNLADSLKTQLGDAENTVKALTMARQAGIVDSEQLDFISKNISLVNKIVSSGVTDPDVVGIIGYNEALRATQENLAALQNPAQAAMETFSKLRDAAFKIFDRQEMQAQQEYNNAMSTLVSKILPNIKDKQYANLPLEEALKKVNDEIEKINAEIDNIQNFDIRNLQMSMLPFEDTIDALQEESSDLANDLTLMDKVADQINEKYDKQADALKQILDINKEIADEQKSQLDLADALSSGDIAAAARVTQEMRAKAAAQSQENSLNNLDAARQDELANIKSARLGMNREQIQKRQFDISQSIFNLEEQMDPIKAKILGYERQIEAKRTQILNLQKDILVPIQSEVNARQTILDKATEAIRKQKEQWDIQQIALDAATTSAGTLATNAQSAASAFEQAYQSYLKISKLTGGATTDSKTQTQTGAQNNKTTTGQNETSAPPKPKYDVPGQNWVLENNRWVLKPKTKAEIDAEAKAQQSEYQDIGFKMAAQQNDVPKTIGNSYNLYPEFTKTEKEMFGITTPQAVEVSAKKIEEANKSFENSIDTLDALNTNLLKLAGITVTKTQPSIGRSSGGGGGMMLMMANGGMVKPKYFANGSLARGTDTIPAMLSPGEFVVRKYAVKDFGLNNLNKINDGSYDGGSVYNYNLSVNVKSDANPNEIARTVMAQIKQVDSQRIRGQM